MCCDWQAREQNDYLLFPEFRIIAGDCESVYETDASDMF